MKECFGKFKIFLTILGLSTVYYIMKQLLHADTTQLLTTSNFIGPWYHAALLLIPWSWNLVSPKYLFSADILLEHQDAKWFSQRENRQNIITFQQFSKMREELKTIGPVFSSCNP